MLINITGIDLFDLNVGTVCAKVRLRCSWILLHYSKHLILNIEIRTAFSRIKDSLPYTAIALQFNRT